jgi:hypothetical protein
MSDSTEITNLISKLTLAVAQRKPFDGLYSGLTFSVWYDQGAIPVISITHPVSGVIYEELASDKPEVMAQMLAPWLNSL